METRSRSGSATMARELSDSTLSVPPLIAGGVTGAVEAGRSSTGMTSRGAFSSTSEGLSNELQPPSATPSAIPPNSTVCLLPMIRICSPHLAPRGRATWTQNSPSPSRALPQFRGPEQKECSDLTTLPFQDPECHTRLGSRNGLVVEQDRGVHGLYGLYGFDGRGIGAGPGGSAPRLAVSQGEREWAALRPARGAPRGQEAVLGLRRRGGLGVFAGRGSSALRAQLRVL